MDTLSTTNLLLGILTVLALLEGLALVAIGVAGIIVGRRCARVFATIESRHVTPAAELLHAILGDVQEVTADIREDVAWLRRLFRRNEPSSGRPS